MFRRPFYIFSEEKLKIMGEKRKFINVYIQKHTAVTIERYCYSMQNSPQNVLCVHDRTKQLYPELRYHDVIIISTYCFLFRKVGAVLVFVIVGWQKNRKDLGDNKI